MSINVIVEMKAAPGRRDELTAVLRTLPAEDPILVGCLLNATAVARSALAMARDQDAGLALFGMRKARPHAAGKALAAGDVPAMLAQARAINDDKTIDAYIPVTMSVADPADGKRKTMAQLAPMLIRDIRKIDLALNASFTEYGFFGGVSIDFYQMGFQSGFLASKLLKGGAVKGTPVEDARRSLVAVNRKRMQQLGIQLSPEARSIVDKWVD